MSLPSSVSLLRSVSSLRSASSLRSVSLPSSLLLRCRPRKTALERGQASVEYALVLLGAALVATLLITWATSTGLIGDLFNHVLNLVKGKAK